MNALKRLLFFSIALVVFLAALLAAADNSEAVALRFLDYESPVWPVSWWMLTAFVVGLLTGTLLNLAANTRLRLDRNRANRTARDRAQELDQIRATQGAE